ncbi:MAG TPA: STAS domain-containing protein [Actinophytocola sp.]|nr:STAS domain-containing protein [Actinophytocola sp.]
MTEAHLAVERVREDAVRIVVGGEIDLANASAVERQIVEAISNQLTEVTLDLTALAYIDSAGLRVLFTLGTRLETLQIALELLVPAESPIRKMIELSGVAAAIPVRPARD